MFISILWRKIVIDESEPFCFTSNLSRMNENSGIPGSTSLRELRQSNSDPFSKLSRFKRFFTDDSFRSICLGFILSSLILSIALIFDANLGNGPIPQHGAVVSSSEVITNQTLVNFIKLLKLDLLNIWRKNAQKYKE